MMAVTKTQKVVSASENVKKLGLLYTVAGNEKGSHYGKQYGDSSEKLEIELHMIQQSHFCMHFYMLKDWDQHLEETSVPPWCLQY